MLPNVDRCRRNVLVLGGYNCRSGDSKWWATMGWWFSTWKWNTSHIHAHKWQTHIFLNFFFLYKLTFLLITRQFGKYRWVHWSLCPICIRFPGGKKKSKTWYIRGSLAKKNKQKNWAIKILNIPSIVVNKQTYDLLIRSDLTPLEWMLLYTQGMRIWCACLQDFTNNDEHCWTSEERKDGHQLCSLERKF